MPEDILYPIKARDEATPVFARFLATLAETDKTTEKLRERVEELARRNQELTASLVKLEEEHGKHSAVLESGTQNVQAWIEAQTKVDALNARIAATDKELEKNKQQLAQAQQKLTEAAQASGGAFERLGNAIKNFAEAPLQTAHQGINALLASLGPTAIGLGAVAAGAAAAGYAVYELARHARDSALQIQNMAAQTGLTVTEVQALNRAAEELGIGDLTRTLANLQMQLGREEGSKFTVTLRMMGIALRDEQGNFRSIVDLLADFSDRLKALGDPARASQLALEAMGIRGRALLPVLLNQNVAFRDYIKELERWAPLTKEGTDELVRHHLEMEKTLRIWETAKHKLGELADKFIATAKAFAAGGGFQGMGFRLGMRMFGGEEAVGPAAAGAPEVPMGPPLPPDYYERMAAERERFERRVSAIAQGLKREELELTIRLGEEEQKLRKLLLEGTEKEVLAQARAVAAVRDRIGALKEAEQEASKHAEEQRRAFEKLDNDARAYAKSAEKYAESLALVIGDDMRELWGRLGAEIRKAEAGLKDFGTAARGVAKDMSGLKEIPSLEPSKHKLEELGLGMKKAGDEARAFSRQVSTVFTDLGRDIADNILEWKGWAESIGNILKDFARGMLRLLIEQLLEPLERRLGGIFGAIAGGGPGGGGLVQFAGAGMGGIFSGLFGGRGGPGFRASEVPDIGAILAGKPTGTGFAASAAGQALTAGGMIAGQMLVADAFRRGSKAEGAAGGAMTGASIGTMIAPGIGTAIGAGIGAVAGFFAGLFGGGEKRRAEERARRAALQSQYLFAAPETIARTGAFGTAGEAEVEADLTGRMRAIVPQAPTVKVEIQAIDLEDFERKKGIFGKLVSRAILAGQGQLADNIAWAAQ